MASVVHAAFAKTENNQLKKHVGIRQTWWLRIYWKNNDEIYMDDSDDDLDLFRSEEMDKDEELRALMELVFSDSSDLTRRLYSRWLYIRVCICA